MEKIIELKIDASLHGRKIEYVLEKHIGLSNKIIRRLKRVDNAVMLNGKNVAVVRQVSEGDKLVITISSRESKNIAPANIPLDILYEDEDIFVVNKPGSMPTHPSRSHHQDTLANAVIHYMGNDSTFHAITRLDRDTSGVVLIAKNSLAAKLLTDDIKTRKIQKEYVAVVNGVPKEKSATLSLPIKKKENSGILRHVSEKGKDSITLYEVEKTMGSLSLVKLIPVTGRTHQLRVHMSYIGNPIYGDSMYGAPQQNERTRLHCRSITFCHPMTKEKLTIKAPIPKDIAVF